MHQSPHTFCRFPIRPLWSCVRWDPVFPPKRVPPHYYKTSKNHAHVGPRTGDHRVHAGSSFKAIVSLARALCPLPLGQIVNIPLLFYFLYIYIFIYTIFLLFFAIFLLHVRPRDATSEAADHFRSATWILINGIRCCVLLDLRCGRCRDLFGQLNRRRRSASDWLLDHHLLLAQRLHLLHQCYLAVLFLSREVLNIVNDLINVVIEIELDKKKIKFDIRWNRLKFVWTQFNK